MVSDRLFLTGPIVFHSFCRRRISDAVASQSVESASASTCAHSASFFARFSAQRFLCSARSACRRVKKRSQALRKRSQIVFSWPRVTTPIDFHSSCSPLISSAVWIQFLESASASTFSHNVTFLARF
jgi:hypothetical protein